MNPILNENIKPMDEKQLIESAKKGDKKALSEIVKMYEQTIYNFSFKICRDKNKAEQIMQETFYSMKHLTRFQVPATNWS